MDKDNNVVDFTAKKETETVKETNVPVKEPEKEKEFLTAEDFEKMTPEEIEDYIAKKYNVQVSLADRTSKKGKTGIPGFRQFKSKQDFMKNCPEWLKPNEIKILMKFSKVSVIYVKENDSFAILKVGNVYHVVDLTSGTKEEKETVDDCVAWIETTKKNIVNE